MLLMLQNINNLRVQLNLIKIHVHKRFLLAVRLKIFNINIIQ